MTQHDDVIRSRKDLEQIFKELRMPHLPIHELPQLPPEMSEIEKRRCIAEAIRARRRPRDGK